MSVEIVQVDKGMLRFILKYLRDIDRYELAACESDLHRMPYEIMDRRVYAFAACNPEPVAAWGLLHWRTGSGAAFAFGTDRWSTAALSVVRHIREWGEPHARVAGYHRIEARALAGRQDVARFMSLIGAQPEAVLQAYGIRGEDFVSYRWLAHEHRRERYATGAFQSHAAH